MEAQEYVIRKALANGKTNEEIAKEYCVDIEYVEELAGTEYQKPQHNFVAQLNETENNEDETEDEPDGSNESGNENDKQENRQSNKKNNKKKVA